MNTLRADAVSLVPGGLSPASSGRRALWFVAELYLRALGASARIVLMTTCILLTTAVVAYAAMVRLEVRKQANAVGAHRAIAMSTGAQAETFSLVSSRSVSNLLQRWGSLVADQGVSVSRSLILNTKFIADAGARQNISLRALDPVGMRGIALAVGVLPNSGTREAIVSADFYESIVMPAGGMTLDACLARHCTLSTAAGTWTVVGVYMPDGFIARDVVVDFDMLATVMDVDGGASSLLVSWPQDRKLLERLRTEVEKLRGEPVKLTPLDAYVTSFYGPVQHVMSVIGIFLGLILLPSTWVSVWQVTRSLVSRFGMVDAVLRTTGRLDERAVLLCHALVGALYFAIGSASGLMVGLAGSRAELLGNSSGQAMGIRLGTYPYETAAIAGVCWLAIGLLAFSGARLIVERKRNSATVLRRSGLRSA